MFIKTINITNYTAKLILFLLLFEIKIVYSLYLIMASDHLKFNQKFAVLVGIQKLFYNVPLEKNGQIKTGSLITDYFERF